MFSQGPFNAGTSFEGLARGDDGDNVREFALSIHVITAPGACWMGGHEPCPGDMFPQGPFNAGTSFEGRPLNTFECRPLDA